MTTMTTTFTNEQAAREIAANNLRLLERYIAKVDAGEPAPSAERAATYGMRVVQALRLASAFPRSLDEFRSVATAGRAALDAPLTQPAPIVGGMTHTRYGSVLNDGRIDVQRRADLGVAACVESFDSTGRAFVTVYDNEGTVLATIAITAPTIGLDR